MKKKIACLLATLMLCITLAGCTGGSQYSSPAGGLIPVPNQDCLYYDPAEKTVYIIYSEYTGYQGYGYMSPYYASNGLPYLFDIATQSLVKNEIGG